MKVKHAVCCLLILLAGPLQSAPEGLMVQDAYIRALPPGVPNSAVYMVMMNHGDQDIEVSGLSASVSDSASIHETLNDDGMMRMQALERVIVPAQGELELVPGGMHVMLMGLQQSLKEGDSVTLTLEFANSDNMDIEVPVISMQQSMNQSIEHHQH